MSNDIYKEAILRVLPQAPDDPLIPPPPLNFDLQGVECPHCKYPDAVIQEVEDAEVAKCPKCQCEFSPKLESISRKVIRQITERRHRQFQRMAEALPREAPPGLDKMDYDLFRYVVEQLYYGKPLTQGALARALETVKAKWLADHNDDEERWNRLQPRFLEALKVGSPQINLMFPTIRQRQGRDDLLWDDSEHQIGMGIVPGRRRNESTTNP